MGCESCRIMTDAVDKITLAAHETAMNRMLKTNFRVVVLCIILIVALIATNIAWLVFLNGFDYESESVEYSQDGRGINIIGDDNEVEHHGTETCDTP